MNPQQLMQIARSGNPEQAIMQMLEQQVASNNPVASNLLNMAKTGNSQGIEEVAKNIMKEKGFDFDKEFNSFRKSLGL